MLAIANDNRIFTICKPFAWLKFGPFAWNGFLSYYFPYFAWLSWFSIFSFFLIRGIKNERAELGT